MQIDQMIALLDHLFGDQVGRALSLRAVHLAGIEPIHALFIDRIEVRYFLLE